MIYIVFCVCSLDDNFCDNFPESSSSVEVNDKVSCTSSYTSNAKKCKKQIMTDKSYAKKMKIGSNEPNHNNIIVDQQRPSSSKKSAKKTCKLNTKSSSSLASYKSTHQKNSLPKRKFCKKIHLADIKNYIGKQDNISLQECDNPIRNIRKTYNESLNTKKNINMYYAILSTVWYVFYGYYDDNVDDTRLHIQYDDSMSITKITKIKDENELETTIFEPIQSTNLIFQHWRTTKWNIKLPNISESVEQNKLKDNNKSKWQKKPVYISLRYLLKLNKWQIFFLMELQNAIDQNIDNNMKTSYMQYCINDANTFFKILGIDDVHINKILGLNIYKVYETYIHTFLNDSLAIKLLIFPEIMSLRQHVDNFSLIKSKYSCKYKIFIACYIMCKFEVFIKYFIHYMLKNVSSVSTDTIIYRLYVSEVYLAYLFNISFRLDKYHILGYTIINRLFFLYTYISEEVFVKEGNFFNFLLYNFLPATFSYDFMSFFVPINKCRSIEEINALIHGILVHNEQKHNILKYFVFNISNLPFTGKKYNKFVTEVTNTQELNYNTICKWIINFRNILVDTIVASINHENMH